MASINFPYYSYPNVPCAGYSNSIEYNKNVIRLNTKIETIIYELPANTLLHISIGAPFEEIFTEGSNTEIKTQFWFQYQQLIPIHILKYFEKFPHGKVVNIVISPNMNFETEKINVITPEFIKKSDSIYHWNKIATGHYVSKKFNIETIIFCCPMPSVDPKNPALYKRLLDIVEKFDGAYDPEKILQTEIDKAFITRFYSNLSRLFNVINSNNGFITVYSYAVFNQETSFSRICRYQMFPEILSLFSGHYKTNRVLAEWVFRHGFYSVVPHNKFSCDIDLISYCSLNTLVDIKEIKTIDFTPSNEMVLIKESVKVKKKNNNTINFTDLDKKFNFSKKETINNRFDIDDFECVNIMPDGDCLFSAVINGLNLDMNVKTLRYKVASYITNNFSIDEIFSTININNLDVDEFMKNYNMNKFDFVQLYLKIMEQKSRDSRNIRDYYDLPTEISYGGYLEIITMCELFKVKINIVQDDKLIAEISPRITTNIIEIHEIYLDYSINHYDLLVKKIKRNKNSKRRNSKNIKYYDDKDEFYDKDYNYSYFG